MSSFHEIMSPADHAMRNELDNEYRAMNKRNLADMALPSPWGPMLRRAGPSSSSSKTTFDDNALSVIEDFIDASAPPAVPAPLAADKENPVPVPAADRSGAKRPVPPPSSSAKKAKRDASMLHPSPRVDSRKRIKLTKVCFTSFCMDPRMPGHYADFANERCNFFICQPEKTSTVHVNDQDIEVVRDHVQGYFELKRQMDMGTVKALLAGPPNANHHLTAAKGTAQQNIVYCTKDGPTGRDETRPDFVLHIGTPEVVEPGRRTDLDRVAQRVVEGATVEQLATTDPGMVVRYGRGLTQLSLVLAKPRVPRFIDGKFVPNEVVVYFGSSGTGKSVKAYNENCCATTYRWTPANGIWFDLLKPDQTTMIVDEFRGQWPMGMLLAMLDSFPMLVAVKGGHVQLPTTKFVFTSPMHPKFWYQNQSNDKIQQLLRRITVLEYFPQDGEEYQDPPNVGVCPMADPYNAQFS